MVHRIRLLLLKHILPKKKLHGQHFGQTDTVILLFPTPYRMPEHSFIIAARSVKPECRQLSAVKTRFVAEVSEPIMPTV
jgi:hypothetical protein